ncbi:MAG: type IV pilin protein [Gammaproteobacteria bacterium]|nr:type IV pilin protein [Gammaproteobacteria bacterium]MBU1655299.1 type IV pilin protein [Gammaproteobacteria bacterium]MBU1960769.1 type IV pilin protein [Gammaproteobacteria bacterium]
MKHAINRKGRGFTLIELMVVVAIVAILASIAYPSYVEQARKARRTDAQVFLMEVANRQEQYLLDRKSYTNNTTQLGYSANPAVSPEGYYSVAAAIAGCGAAPCYLLTATPISGKAQASDSKCTTLTLNSQGVKEATGSGSDPDTECW